MKLAWKKRKHIKARIRCVVNYRPKRSFGQGNIFTPVCHSVHGGGSGKETSPHGWMENPPGWKENPPPAGWRAPPGRRTPPGWMENPPSWMENPPPHPLAGRRPPRLEGEPPPAGWRTPRLEGEPPRGKQTPAYGLRTASTHPTGMHSCFFVFCQENLILVPFTAHRQQVPSMYQYSRADPGFPIGGGVKFSEKLHEIENFLGRRG